MTTKQSTAGLAFAWAALLVAAVCGLAGCGGSQTAAATTGQAAARPATGTAQAGDAPAPAGQHEAAAKEEDSKDESKDEPKAGSKEGAKEDSTEESKEESKEDKGGEKDGAVTLEPELVKRLGIATAQAQAVTYKPAAEGFGVVLAHDSIAQLAADLETAAAAARQSQAALERMKHLQSGPGAVGADVLETAAKQASADQAALTLARRKLTATFGLKFPGQGADSGGVLVALANGTFKLARITFSPGALSNGPPHALRLFSLDSSSPSTESALNASAVWDAPQDPTIPGRSLFALLRTADIPEGTRLDALPVSDNGVPGVLIPASAVVVAGGQYWCYVRKGEGTFVRAPIDVDRPLAQGYFVAADKLAPGDEIVTAGAGLLLARQINPASDSEGGD
jgi:hypothetical protein